MGLLLRQIILKLMIVSLLQIVSIGKVIHTVVTLFGEIFWNEILGFLIKYLHGGCPLSWLKWRLFVLAACWYAFTVLLLILILKMTSWDLSKFVDVVWDDEKLCLLPSAIFVPIITYNGIFQHVQLVHFKRFKARYFRLYFVEWRFNKIS